MTGSICEILLSKCDCSSSVFRFRDEKIMPIQCPQSIVICRHSAVSYYHENTVFRNKNTCIYDTLFSMILQPKETCSNHFPHKSKSFFTHIFCICFYKNLPSNMPPANNAAATRKTTTPRIIFLERPPFSAFCVVTVLFSSENFPVCDFVYRY